MAFKIVADSSLNLQKLASDIPFEKVPLTITAGDKDFVDNTDLDVKGMVDFLRNYKGKSCTACPSVAAYLSAFEGAEEIFCVTITSNLSGSCNSARVAKEEYETTHPGCKVCIIDSLSAGPELNLIVEKLEEFIGQGKDFDAISKEIAAYQERTGLMFSLESLKNLANNGRVSPLVARLAGTLGICVVGKASDVGTLEQMSKCRGEKKAIITLYKHMKDLGYAGGKVRIDHCENESAADKVKELILQEYPDADITTDITRGLCSFYAELGGLLVGYEKG
uniref:DegV family protein n=1 Tax=Acetatifactor sp. TaxID=1872090 RepID=UPI004055EB89